MNHGLSRLTGSLVVMAGLMGAAQAVECSSFIQSESAELQSHGARITELAGQARTLRSLTQTRNLTDAEQKQAIALGRELCTEGSLAYLSARYLAAVLKSPACASHPERASVEQIETSIATQYKPNVDTLCGPIAWLKY